MSRRIDVTLSSPEALALAEAARRYHYSICTHEDYKIASSLTPHYKESQRMFRKAIKIAYPHMDANRIYKMWVDCMEDIAYCVAYIKKNGYPF